MVDQHDAVVDHHADQDDHPHEGDHVELEAEQPEQPEAAEEGKWQGDDDRQRLGQRLEERGHQEHHDQQGEQQPGEHRLQPLVAVAPPLAPVPRIALGQREPGHPIGDPLLRRFGRDPLVELGRDPDRGQAVLAIDLRLRALDRDVGDGAERHRLGVGSRHHQLLERSDPGLQVVGQRHQHLELVVAQLEAGQVAAAIGQADHLRDRARRHPEQPRLLGIDQHQRLLLPLHARADDVDELSVGLLAQPLLQAHAEILQVLRVVAVERHRHQGAVARAAAAPPLPVADGDLETRHLRHPFLELAGQLGDARLGCRLGLDVEPDDGVPVLLEVGVEAAVAQLLAPRLDPVLEAVDVLLHLLLVGRVLGVEEDLHVLLPLLGLGALLDLGDRPRRRAGEQHQPEEGHQPVAQRPAEQRAIARHQALGNEAGAQLARRHEAAGGERDQGQRDDQRADHRRTDGQRDLTEIDRHRAAVGEEEPRPDEDRGGGRGDHRQRHLPRAEPRRRRRRQPLLLQSVDVLDDDDAVVDQHADAEHQAEQGEHVELRPEQVHEAAGDEQREGDRHRDHQRRRNAAQEEVEDRHRQQAAEDPGVAQAAEGPADLAAGVVPDQQLDALELGVVLDLGNAGHQPVDGVDGVGRRLLEDREADGELAIEMAAEADARLDDLDLRHVADREPAGQRQGRDLRGGVEAAERAHLVAQRLGLDGADVEVEVGVLERRHQLARLDAVAAHRRGIDRHPQLARLDAAEVDRGDALDALERPLDVAVEQLPRLGEVALGRDACLEDRAVGRTALEGAVGDAADVLGQPRHGALGRFAHLELLEVDVGVPVELGAYLRLPRAGRRGEALEPGDGGNLLLERLHDLAQVLERMTARVLDLDEHHRRRHGGHEVERQLEHRDGPEHHQRQEQHQRRHRPVERQEAVTIGRRHRLRSPRARARSRRPDRPAAARSATRRPRRRRRGG